MTLYLAQHGLAKTKEESPTRELTEQGASEVKKMANWLLKRKVSINGIYHSDKLRSKQTADIFKNLLNCPSFEENGLSPTDNTNIILTKLEKFNNNLLIGHLPHLEKLCSSLILNNEEIKLLEFQNAGIACLELKNNVWKIKWVIRPDLV